MIFKTRCNQKVAYSPWNLNFYCFMMKYSFSCSLIGWEVLSIDDTIDNENDVMVVQFLFLWSVSCTQFSEKWTLKPFNFITGNKSIAISHKKFLLKLCLFHLSFELFLRPFLWAMVPARTKQTKYMHIMHLEIQVHASGLMRAWLLVDAHLLQFKLNSLVKFF